MELLGALLRRPPAAAVLIALAVRPRQAPERAVCPRSSGRGTRQPGPCRSRRAHPPGRLGRCSAKQSGTMPPPLSTGKAVATRSISSSSPDGLSPQGTVGCPGAVVGGSGGPARCFRSIGRGTHLPLARSPASCSKARRWQATRSNRSLRRPPPRPRGGRSRRLDELLQLDLDTPDRRAPAAFASATRSSDGRSSSFPGRVATGRPRTQLGDARLARGARDRARTNRGFARQGDAAAVRDAPGGGRGGRRAGTGERRDLVRRGAAAPGRGRAGRGQGRAAPRPREGPRRNGPVRRRAPRAA